MRTSPCGSQGHGWHRAVLLGSVTHRVTAEAACPVIVPTHGGEATLEALLAAPA